MFNKIRSSAKKHKFEYSFVFQSYDMREEVKNTLMSVTPEYQGVDKDLFEVLVVENPSKNSLQESDLSFYNGNLQFVKNKNNIPITSSINSAVRKSRGRNVIICVDAARILSSGVLRYCEQARRLDPDPVVAFHSFHLGMFPQQYSVEEGLYSKDEERRFLKDIKFPRNPKALFLRSSWAGSSKTGFFFQMAEANCLMLSRSTFDEIGGFDERLDSPSGGLANLDLYSRAIESPHRRLFFVLGEGSFHQHHGGDTTAGGASKFDQYRKEFRRKTGKDWSFPKRRDYEFLGHLPPEAMRLAKQSVVRSIETLSRSRPARIISNLEDALSVDVCEANSFLSEKEVNEFCLLYAMHRSKSSFLARLLVDGGYADVPGSVLGGVGSSNPNGHFEPHEIVILHNRILSELGQSWRSISSIDFSKLDDGYFDFCVERIIKTLRWGVKKNGELSPGGCGSKHDLRRLLIKDPRMCRLRPLWEEVVQRLGGSSKSIILIDHPKKIAQSLYKRDALPHDVGELLWLRYNLDVLRNVKENDLVLNVHSIREGELVESLNRFLVGFSIAESGLRHNVKYGAGTEISEIFEDYCGHGSVSRLVADLESVEEFIARRPGLFRAVDDFFREVS